MPWSRKRPDGYELKWLLSLATGSHRGVAPFLIEDITPRTERIPQNFGHKNSVAGIEKVTVAVGELATVEKWYGALLGSSGQKIVAADLGAEGLAFHAGPHIFEFLAPARRRQSIGQLAAAIRPIAVFRCAQDQRRRK